ncbi:MAG: hypothetical protein LBS92_05785 [Candidatus Methanoplasma sp.]|jgi:transposase-like protein|nr:hypothetical protein [Candidatus Methanoplasma sp.]
MGKRGPKPKHLDVSCPRKGCKKHGVCGSGNITANGTCVTKGGDVLMKFICKGCGSSFSSRTGTAYDGLRTSHDEHDLAVHMLQEGSGIRAAARVTGHSPNTVMRWMRGASEHAESVGEALEEGLSVETVQTGETWAVVKKTQNGREDVQGRRHLAMDGGRLLHAVLPPLPGGT